MKNYRVQAYNTAHSSENKIHDDAVARRFGFTGGLVPGVDVYAYMMHLPVARWGRAFLEPEVPSDHPSSWKIASSIWALS